MRISDHYQGFPEKTLIVITNNERARFFRGEGHDFEEIDLIIMPDDAPAAETSSPPNEDAMKAHRLTELYKRVSERLDRGLRHENFKTITICIPEVNKHLLPGALSADVAKHVGATIPKNLANMELAPMIRILLEG